MEAAFSPDLVRDGAAGLLDFHGVEREDGDHEKTGENEDVPEVFTNRCDGNRAICVCPRIPPEFPEFKGLLPA